MMIAIKKILETYFQMLYFSPYLRFFGYVIGLPNVVVVSHSG